jgi:hypothetical protein
MKNFDKLRSLAVLYFFLLITPLYAQTTWTGAFSTDWNTAGNWSSGVPTPTTAVTINASTNNPILPANTTIGSLTLNNNANLNLNGFTLQVNGNFLTQNSATPKTIRNGNIIVGDTNNR